ncbi:MarR family winged helix-turn-helix transcriptional regulator [Ferrimonas kyonanensis]|uniref:MarR family winged helix-turn-helix transcriptional regulator n=1 Tax=Ferrimonas kyonanensis TaxID=364763 RepID=UPI000487635E|nr:MarR family transcriptional regulator [Ferrimonas kyonanensis]
MSKNHDHIDKISQQWKENHSGFSHELVEIIGRFSRLNKHLDMQRLAVYKRIGINSGEFDVLATLYRNGAPFRLMPSDLIKQTLLTSGAMTNRLDKLEQKGLILRENSNEDRRCVFIELSDSGLMLIKKGMPLYFEVLNSIYNPLDDDEQNELNALLKKWMTRFE